ncbi:MAG: putative integrase [Thermoleophilia bacterium]|nr:putative integrase [Thermoleophilia bacterium]
MPRVPSVTITERTPGKWSVRWREHGRQREERGHATEAEAERRRFEIEARLRSGLPGVRAAVSVRELTLRWWDDYVLTLDASTRTNYQTPARRIFESIGETDASTLSTPSLIAWRDDLAAYLTPRLVNDCLKILSSVYQRALEWGTVEANPVRAVPRLTEPATSIVVPTREHAAAVGITAPTLTARARLVVAATVGLRPGEQLALEWRHVHDETIRVEQSLKMNGRIGATKTRNSNRTVPIASAARSVLDELQRATRHHRSTDPVFATPHGVFLNPSRFRIDIWYPWRIEAGVPNLDWGAWRHYYAAACASAGASLLQCSRWMGHSSIATTAKHYAYLFDEDAHAVMERIG